MSVGAIATCLLSLLSAILVTPLVLLLNSYLASILPYKKNIFTYLDQFFIRVALFRVYAGVNTLKHSLYKSIRHLFWGLRWGMYYITYHQALTVQIHETRNKFLIRS